MPPKKANKAANKAAEPRPPASLRTTDKRTTDEILQVAIKVDPKILSWGDVSKLKSLASVADPDITYLEEIVDSVTGRLTALLKEGPAVGGIGLVGPLHCQSPLPASSGSDGGHKNLQAFREPMTEVDCRDRLHICRTYEGGGNLWWMSVKPVIYKTKTLPGCEMTWAQFQAGRAMWSDEKPHVIMKKPACQNVARKLKLKKLMKKLRKLKLTKAVAASSSNRPLAVAETDADTDSGDDSGDDWLA